MRVKAPGGAPLITYSYDGLNRRITETAGTVRDLYYSAQWQVLEERVGGVARVQYVWSPVYVDAMILRDRDTDNNGSLNERLWVVQDANWNVTALVNNTGNVVERFAYDPYGVASVFAPNWSARGSSLYGWTYLHQGGRFEGLTGLHYFRNRDYSATLGRWITQDPIGFNGRDADLYRYVNNSPASRTDALGLVQGVINPNLAGPCGPDVTDWFFDDMQLHFQFAIGQAKKESLRDFNKYAGTINYKCMPFKGKTPVTKACEETVTLCGMCINNSELGNIVFGLAGAAWGWTDFILLVAAKTVGNALKNPWDMAAFQIGYALFDDPTWITSPEAMCKALKKNPNWRTMQAPRAGICLPSSEKYKGEQSTPGIPCKFPGVKNEDCPPKKPK